RRRFRRAPRRGGPGVRRLRAVGQHRRGRGDGDAPCRRRSVAQRHDQPDRRGRVAGFSRRRPAHARRDRDVRARQPHALDLAGPGARRADRPRTDDHQGAAAARRCAHAGGAGTRPRHQQGAGAPDRAPRPGKAEDLAARAQRRAGQRSAGRLNEVAAPAGGSAARPAPAAPAAAHRRAPEHRVLIAGGGHAGLLLGLALERVGLRPVILDAEPVEATLGAPFAGRALALMYGSRRVCEALGLWPRLAPIAEPIHAVRLEDRGTGAAIVYQAAEIVDHPFGYGIETRALRRILLELALERPGIEIVAPARLVALERSTSGIAAELDDGRRLEAALIVGADGRGSTVRARAGLDGTLRAYAQTALTFALRHARPHEGR